MQPQKKSQITIIGAGLAGCFLAVLLAKRGFPVTIYERMSRKDTLQTSMRSINISFHNYGSNALKIAGVWNMVKPGIIPLSGSVTKLPHYRPILASFKNLKLDYFSARREKLLAALITKAESYPNIRFSFNTELINVDRAAKQLLIRNRLSGKISTINTDVIVGADGVNSTVRSFLQRGQHTLHSQNHSGWEYKQVQFSPDMVKKLKLHTDRAYSSTRKETIFVSLPNIDGTFSGMLAVSPAIGFASMPTDADKEAFITKYFPELFLGMSEIIPALRKNPNGSFITMKTFPWRYKDFMVLVGDAGHSVTPFIGHGVTIGFGDCLTLVKLIDTYGENWTKVFETYQESRKKNVDILVDMSLESFGNFQRERKANFGIIYATFESLLHTHLPFMFSSSIFERIVYDPDNAHAYRKQHLKQRKLMKYLGAPLLVRATTLSILGFEKSAEQMNKLKKRNLTI